MLAVIAVSFTWMPHHSLRPLAFLSVLILQLALLVESKVGKCASST
jgi:hypothetical protein